MYSTEELARAESAMWLKLEELRDLNREVASNCRSDCDDLCDQCGCDISRFHQSQGLDGCGGM